MVRALAMTRHGLSPSTAHSEATLGKLSLHGSADGDPPPSAKIGIYLAETYAQIRNFRTGTMALSG